LNQNTTPKGQRSRIVQSIRATREVHTLFARLWCLLCSWVQGGRHCVNHVVQNGPQVFIRHPLVEVGAVEV